MSGLGQEIELLRNLLAAQERESVSRLKDSLNSQSPIDEFPRIQSLVMRVSDGFMKRGWPPLRVQASYFSQSGSRSFFEVSWLRTDLMASLSPGSSRTTTSHGPGFRLHIGSDPSPAIQMQSRHSVEARGIFIKNVLSPTSSRWIEPCLRRLKGSRIVVKWTEEWYRVRSLETLQVLAQAVRNSREFDSLRYSYFFASKSLWPEQLEDEDRLAPFISGFFARMAPLFWAHHMLLEPKAARTSRQAKHQISREQLRKDILKLESRCQHVNCPLEGGDPRMLKVAHLSPRVNLLSNVIVLCPLCYDEQFPATSIIKVTGEETPGEPGMRSYRVVIQTRDGPKDWRVISHIEHPLSNPRSR